MSFKLAEKLPLRLSAFHIRGSALSVLHENSEVLRAMLTPITFGFYGMLEAWPELQSKFKTGALYEAKMRHAYVLMSGVFGDEYLASVDAFARACVEHEIDRVELMLAHSLTGQELLRQLGVGRPQNQPAFPATLPETLSRIVALDLINLIERHQEIVREVSQSLEARSAA